MVQKNPHRKLSFKEIRQLIQMRELDKLFEAINSALENDDKPFYLKITRARNRYADFTVIVNGKVEIDLVQDSDLKSRNSIAITSSKVAIEPSQDISSKAPPIYFVSIADYERFCTDASKIFNEYCQNGMNFGRIPSKWFSDLGLVDFIRNTIWSSEYFQKRMSSQHVEVGTDWSKE